MKTSDPDIDHLAGSYKKTDQYTASRPVYQNSVNQNFIFYDGEWNISKQINPFLTHCAVAPHWYIGLRSERRVRSKATDWTMVPLIQWQFQQDDGQWRELKAPNDPWFPEPFNIFTLNITIEDGKSEIRVHRLDTYLGPQTNGQRVELKTVEMETRIKQMQVYDHLLELDIEENEKSLR